MTRQDIALVTVEIRRFQERVRELDSAINERKRNELYLYPRQTGAIRRASMDLTRALAKMRKP